MNLSEFINSCPLLYMFQEKAESLSDCVCGLCAKLVHIFAKVCAKTESLACEYIVLVLWLFLKLMCLSFAGFCVDCGTSLGQWMCAYRH